jgi:hypothetical protein
MHPWWLVALVLMPEGSRYANCMPVEPLADPEEGVRLEWEWSASPWWRVTRPVRAEPVITAMDRRGAGEGSCGDEWSSSPFVLMDDAAEDVAPSDGATVDHRLWAGDRLFELQATVWTSLVVVADVLVECRF